MAQAFRQVEGYSQGAQSIVALKTMVDSIQNVVNPYESSNLFNVSRVGSLICGLPIFGTTHAHTYTLLTRVLSLKRTEFIVVYNILQMRTNHFVLPSNIELRRTCLGLTDSHIAPMSDLIA